MKEVELPIKFFRNRHFLVESIERWAKEGYDSIHTPGGKGKSKKRTHASFIFAWYYHKFLKEVYLLVLPYKSSFHENEEEDSMEFETPLKTAVREFKEETGIKLYEKNLRLFNKVQVQSNVKIGDIHEKFFYVYTKYLTDEQIKREFLDKSGETLAPFLLRKSLLKDYLFPGHYTALKNK